jgi:ABC-type methionine transport system permease subunit
MRKKNEITEYVAAALIFVCAVAVSLGIFLVCTQNSIERNSQKVIKTNVSRVNILKQFWIFIMDI